MQIYPHIICLETVSLLFITDYSDSITFSFQIHIQAGAGGFKRLIGPRYFQKLSSSVFLVVALKLLRIRGTYLDQDM